MALQSNLQIAAGNDNAAGLTAIESVLTLTSSARGIVQSWGNYTKGIQKFRADGTIYNAGFPSTRWVFPVLGFAQYVYLQTTYCGGAGNYSGLVTIKTNAISNSTYTNYNATLVIPMPSELQASNSRQYYINAALQFNRLEAL